MMLRKQLAITASFALLLVANDVVDASERNRGPGPLLLLMAQSDVIAVAAFEAQEPPPKGIVLLNSRTNLRFRLVRTLAGTTKAKTVLLPVRVGRTKYSILHGAKRALLFLKKGKDGDLDLPSLPGYHTCFRLEGDNAGLAKELEQYLTVRCDRPKGAKGRQALRTFLIGKVATSKSEYFRRNMAYDLWAMVDRVRKPGFSKEDTEAIAKVALSEKSYSVAVPLCLTLDQLGSDKTDDCILHALLDTSPGTTSVQLAEVIAKRKQLVQKLLARLKDVKDPDKLSRVVLHFLRQAPDAKAHAFYRDLWQRNPAARPVLKTHLARYERERALLRELESGTPVAPSSEGGKKKALPETLD